MKTPEEIKATLLRYISAGSGTCLLDDCPLDSDVPRAALTYIEQLEERIQLMLIQMKGDCGVCKHRLDERKLDDKQLGCRLSPACYECLKKDGREMWEYEGLPE